MRKDFLGIKFLWKFNLFEVEIVILILCWNSRDTLDIKIL